MDTDILGRTVVRRVFFFALLIVPYVAVLATPLYNRTDPEIAGIPFFYWYQLLWIPLGSVLLFLVYLATKHTETQA
jgi:Protein of unknown function (DUF3311)